MDFNNFSDVKKIKTKKSAKVDLGYNHERGRGGRGNGEGLFQFWLITTCYSQVPNKQVYSFIQNS